MLSAHSRFPSPSPFRFFFFNILGMGRAQQGRRCTHSADGLQEGLQRAGCQEGYRGNVRASTTCLLRLFSLLLRTPSSPLPPSPSVLCFFSRALQDFLQPMGEMVLLVATGCSLWLAVWSFCGSISSIFQSFSCSVPVLLLVSQEAPHTYPQTRRSMS